MLIEFRVSNYRSIGEEQVLSLIPAQKQKEYLENIFTKGKHSALNALAIYGANGSGKSNLLLAMGLFDKLIHLSARSSSTTKLPYDPFLLREGWESKPTKFEITFIVQEYKYRYGIEFQKEAIVSEWLYRKSEGREVVVFLRREDTIDASSGFKGNTKVIDAAIEATRPNALFLSTCDMLNIEEAKTIFQWFKHFNNIDGIDTEDEEIRTLSMWDNELDRENITEYLLRLNLGFVGIDISKKDFDEADLPKNINESTRSLLIRNLSDSQSYSVLALHKIYSSDGTETGKNIAWNFDERESKGTNKAFHLSGPILWALKNGGVLIIDEIEAKMHPLLTLDTINMFLNQKTNPNKAQLIFATHDTNLLSYSNLRRDQIYFTEKNKWESTEIFSLSDFIYLGENNIAKSEKERPDTDKEKRYFEGRYGAVPFLSPFKPLKSKNNGKKG
ncbi:AAA family ATPase [Parasediminibacterium sp. JCM 36343]|uniref:AAA family ATPase n=1 Tax=Parasediminibacterium sp. JCM 36343 TaxID=3374279 RepID=UPI00397C0E7E